MSAGTTRHKAGVLVHPIDEDACVDRIARLHALIDQALDQLSRPNALAHEEYAVVETLHAIVREVEALRADEELAR